MRSFEARHCYTLPLLGAALALGGCDSDSSRCSSIPAFITGLDTPQNARRIASESTESAQTYRPTQSGETIAIDEYLISAKTRGSELSNPLFNVSFVKRCDPPVRRSSSVLDDLDIVSSADLSMEYPAGTSLRDVTRIRVETTLPGRPDDAIDYRYEFNAGRSAPTIVEYLERGGNEPLRFLITLDTPTDAVREHSFTVTLEASTGTTYATITEPVTLSPTQATAE